jgi:hypothetical protein
VEWHSKQLTPVTGSRKKEACLAEGDDEIQLGTGKKK